MESLEDHPRGRPQGWAMVIATRAIHLWAQRNAQWRHGGAVERVWGCFGSGQSTSGVSASATFTIHPQNAKRLYWHRDCSRLVARRPNGSVAGQQESPNGNESEVEQDADW